MATFTKVYHRTPYPAIDPAAPQNSMKGRSILIAGATGGIGLATAHAYAKASPQHIIILGRREEALSIAVAELNNALPENSSTKITSKPCDIGDPVQVDKLWVDLKSDHLAVDVLVLNAAATPSTQFKRLQDMIPFFEINVAANLRMADGFLDQGPPTGKVLINVSSMAAHTYGHGDTLDVAAYCSSKAAGAAALQYAADCYSVEKCQIVNVHPGAILTESARRAGYDENSIPWDDPALPGSFFVWASTPQAAFLHGRFVWCHWDVDELVAMKARFDDPGFLRLGLQGMPSIGIKETFATIAEWDKERGQGVS